MPPRSRPASWPVHHPALGAGRTATATARQTPPRPARLDRCWRSARRCSQPGFHATSSSSPPARRTDTGLRDIRRPSADSPAGLRPATIDPGTAAFNPHSAPPPVRRFSTTGSFGYRPRGVITSLINIGSPRPPAKRLSALWRDLHSDPLPSFEADGSSQWAAADVLTLGLPTDSGWSTARHSNRSGTMPASSLAW